MARMALVGMAGHIPPISVLLSYAFDWLVVIALVGAGGGINSVTPVHRAFSLVDLSISYPFIPESVSTATLVVVGFIAPAIIIFLVVAIFVPGPAFWRSSTKTQAWRIKAWELHIGGAGLALSVASAFFITQGAKNMFGKPRPDFLARCMPDLANIAAHVVGGYGQDISAKWTLVSSSICTRTDSEILDDGYRSFPSGHSSFSWAGLLYLSLFLCSKFNIVIPFLPAQPSEPVSLASQHPHDTEMLPLHNRDGTEDSAKPSTSGDNANNIAHTSSANHAVSLRNLAAAPPNYLLVLAFVPIAVAFYVSASRYAQYYHHGFDIVFGALIGILTAWGSFRWYHLPLSRGQGWAWGARTSSRAWGIGVGVNGYVGPEGWANSKNTRTGLENGNGRV